MELLQNLSLVLGLIMSAIALFTLIFTTTQKQFKKSVDKAYAEHIKQIYKIELVQLYYSYKAEKRDYDKRLFLEIYQKYKDLGGNSYIDALKDEVNDN